MSISYLTRVQDIAELSTEEQRRLAKVTDTFAFRSNSYYQELINWADPDDPIRRLVVPHEDELQEWGSLDASNEAKYTVLPGLEHKYPDTVVLLINNVCGALCRFCFRKRLFLKGNQEVSRNTAKDIQYIRKHTEIRNVLLTGGDPLLMSTARLRPVLESLAAVRHVRIVRIGSKMTAFNPYRVLDDPALLELFEEIIDSGTRLYLMNHFNHPRELTDAARLALQQLASVGVMMTNQTPMIKGINDDPVVLSELFNQLSYLAIPPYYVFQCRPTKGNLMYSLPLEQAYRNFIEAWRNSSGLARRARFVMSHHTGKIELTGLTKGHIMFRYHRAPDPRNDGKTIICRRNPRGYWFDDFAIVASLSDTMVADEGLDENTGLNHLRA
jgi:KamA family protein